MKQPSTASCCLWLAVTLNPKSPSKTLQFQPSRAVRLSPNQKQIASIVLHQSPASDPRSHPQSHSQTLLVLLLIITPHHSLPLLLLLLLLLLIPADLRHM
jgi:hypothetical protein